MTQKSNTDEFIKKANAIHNNRYDYSKSIYMGIAEKLIIICSIHGEFLQRASDHIKGINCSKCSGKKTLTTSEFINKAIVIHDNKYDYSEACLVNNNSKVRIFCYEHGVFEQTPYEHLKGHGCSKCAGVSKLTKEDFIKTANKIHNFKYNYDKVNLLGSKNKIIICCKSHGEFLQTPNRHTQGDGCPKCGFDISANTCRAVASDVFAKAYSVHNNKYDYSKFIYKNNRVKGVIICQFHGEFEQCMDGHINQKQGCPRCSNIISKPEREWLDFLKISESFRQPKKFKIRNYKIKPDAYDPTTNTIYEFYGDYYHGNPAKFKSEDVNLKVKKTYGELYHNTLKKESLIKEAGYNLVSIWESDWKLLRR